MRITFRFNLYVQNFLLHWILFDRWIFSTSHFQCALVHPEGTWVGPPVARWTKLKPSADSESGAPVVLARAWGTRPVSLFWLTWLSSGLSLFAVALFSLLRSFDVAGGGVAPPPFLVALALLSPSGGFGPTWLFRATRRPSFLVRIASPVALSPSGSPLVSEDKQ
jgi:hypothetical protein